MEEDKSALEIQNQPNVQVSLRPSQQLRFGFNNLNADFLLPKDFRLVKKLGSGAFGKVMQILHVPTGREYACKRFEDVFDSELRAKRLLREINIIKLLNHPCINKLKCVIPPELLQ
jgi:serine/threonine protein kinase